MTKKFRAQGLFRKIRDFRACLSNNQQNQPDSAREQPAFGITVSGTRSISGSVDAGAYEKQSRRAK
jgi:hypothetical protein